MSEKWIVAVNMTYYPEVEEFPSEEAAREHYDEQVRIYSPSAAVYLARVVERASELKE